MPTKTSPHSSSDEAESSAFHRLQVGVQRWIWRKGWKSLRPIQERAVPLILDAQRDVIITAATAGGKTEAAFLPVVSSLASTLPDSFGCLCLSPLKALINDQSRRLEELCGSAQVPLHPWHGDIPHTLKRAALNLPSGLLLMTPESLEANCVLRGSELTRLFQDLRYVVIDELHVFIATERGRHLQSLLHRLEATVGRRVPRIGLSATLGNMELAAEFLRPRDGKRVVIIKSDHDQRELKLQLRGYRRAGSKSADDSLELIATHLFETLRTRDNLVFTNARVRVEALADCLRQKSEQLGVPNEFLPHHGSLAPELRDDAETLLKDPARPGNVVCTTTLELGIDVGNVVSIAQVDAPTSTAGLRQRLGRSGRRDEDPAIMRLYITEREIEPDTSLQDSLRAELVLAIAMVQLLLDRWYEPPLAGQLHLSTLMHQVLSLIAQLGGVQALEGYRLLCGQGPFVGVDTSLFAELLRAMGRADLVTQMGDGTLVLGLAGERLVEHYSFYSAFTTMDEYRLLSDGRQVGSLPVSSPVVPGASLVFAGRRWRVIHIDVEGKAIQLSPTTGGSTPFFTGGDALVHDRVRDQMRCIYLSSEMPIFLDETAKSLLSEGRRSFTEAQLHSRSIVEEGKDTLLFPWCGDRIHLALSLMLQQLEIDATNQGVSIVVPRQDPHQVCQVLERIAHEDPPDAGELALLVKNRIIEKFDRYLPEDLSCLDYASRYLDVQGAWETAKRLSSSFV